MPNNFCGGCISLVPKNGSLRHKSAYYRLVTIINIIATVFNYCLLSKLSGLAILDDLRLGFIINDGCDNAVFIAISVIGYCYTVIGTLYVLANCIKSIANG